MWWQCVRCVSSDERTVAVMTLGSGWFECVARGSRRGRCCAVSRATDVLVAPQLPPPAALSCLGLVVRRYAHLLLPSSTFTSSWWPAVGSVMRRSLADTLPPFPAEFAHHATT